MLMFPSTATQVAQRQAQQSTCFCILATNSSNSFAVGTIAVSLSNQIEYHTQKYWPP
jgi:hypothetical protein